MLDVISFMNQNSNIKQIAPMMPSSDVAGTAEFLTKALGFKSVMVSPVPGYDVLARDGREIHIVDSEDETPNELSVYINTGDLTALWDHFSSFKDEALSIREPFEQPYGMKEFHVILPYTNALLMIGAEA